ncbi:hypothetical protein COEREDRAFT_89620 [Coemansia reversa NRRL 1564]|uniref:Uncharacterized protein n=1 Tax=Coemansia reversa (strain ATCC 12441 / NRRL 1564) TaxID=763665 RepID=A0A2G5B320_COERN|nr:hypothetical protein COEREDRAFT_89620 [Coemansia reversa NRRL 1564]|eukprot:PIA13418.1 hypothetical protein COEREDRAFT_89620 [Coemansia reversa NRRL 1564]
MFDYPPMNPIRRATYTRSYGQAASKVRVLTDLVKKRRHDISIGLQSLLSTIYAVELVFYFIRLRHLASRHLAAWRASLMLILLVVDFGMIWLTFRSKKSKLSESANTCTRYENRAFPNYAEHGIGVPATALSSLPNSSSYRASPSAMGPNEPQPSAATTHDNAEGNPFASDTITRSHLNTPITG